MSKTEELLKSLKEQRKLIEDKVKPLRDKRNALIEKMQPMEDEARELAKEIQKTQGETAFALDREISMLSRALGSRTLMNG